MTPHPMLTPGAPVPPREWISARFMGDSSYSDDLRAAAAWGHAQAMPEREKLAALLAKAHDTLRHCGYNTHPQVGQSLLTLAAECHDAAERLRGGGR